MKYSIVSFFGILLCIILGCSTKYINSGIIYTKSFAFINDSFPDKIIETDYSVTDTVYYLGNNYIGQSIQPFYSNVKPLSYTTKYAYVNVDKKRFYIYDSLKSDAKLLDKGNLDLKKDFGYSEPFYIKNDSIGISNLIQMTDTIIKGVKLNRFKGESYDKRGNKFVCYEFTTPVPDDAFRTHRNWAFENKYHCRSIISLNQVNAKNPHVYYYMEDKYIDKPLKPEILNIFKEWEKRMN